MHKISANLIIIFYLSFVACRTIAKNADELLSVVAIFRHGDRTPIDPYPNDPYRNSSYWPVDFGQLTNTGKMQQFHLGQWLRSRYSAFLPAEYSERDVYVRSTDVDRTLMSAAANLAGLYPPAGAQVWLAGLKWQPVPVHSVPETQDALLAMKRPCPRYAELHKRLLAAPFFTNISHHNHDLYAYLTRYSGTLVNTLERVEYIYNTLYIETLYNYTLPAWAAKVFPAKLEPWARLSFAVNTFTPSLARLKTGPLFSTIIEHFRNNTADFQTNFAHKMLLFSAHDVTIASILNSMGAFPYHCPPYASTILFELWRRNGKEYINVFYKNTTNTLNNITVKGCRFDCNFDEFVNVMSPISLTLAQWEDECKLTFIDTLIRYNDVWMLVLISILGCLFVILSGLASCKLFRHGHGRGKNARLYTQLPDDEVA